MSHQSYNLPQPIKAARLDFLGGIPPKLIINWVGLTTAMGKWLPHLYYIKKKTSDDLGFIAIGVAIAT